MIKTIKKTSIAILFGAVTLSIFLVGRVYAQVAVTFNGQPGTDDLLSCNIDSTGSSIAGIPAGVPVPLLINPDSKIYSITGNYNVQIDCGDQAGTQNCTNLTNAVNAIGNEAAGIPNFPQLTTAPSNNTLKYVVGHFNNQVCNNSQACEATTEVIGDDGIVKVQATIYLDEDWRANSSAQSPLTVLAQLGSPNCIQSTLTHETGHAFGLGDAYIFDQTSPTIMGGNNVNTCQGLAQGQNLPALTYDPSSLAAIQAIDTGQSINITSPVELSCISRCTSAAAQGIFAINTSTGYYEPDCQIPTGQSAISYGSYCDCNPTDGSAPYCVNQNGEVSAAPVDVCSSASSGGSSASSSPIDGCSCLLGGPECFDASGNLIAIPPAVSASDWCSPGVVPSGEVCSCISGVASCSDSSGSVEPPSGFSCQLSQASSTNTNGYECQDNACVYVGSGGTYSDATCDNACGGD